jgi:hypothetical protein
MSGPSHDVDPVALEAAVRAGHEADTVRSRLLYAAAIVFGIVALGLSYWMSALIAGIGLAVIGYLLIHTGSATLRHATLTPEHTVETLKEDAQWLKSQAR